MKLDAPGHRPLDTQGRARRPWHGPVKLPAKVKPARYFVVVRETTLKGKRVGRLIRFKFTLK